MAKRTIMRSLKMLEISGVDRPAQVGARAVLTKRAWAPDAAEAEAALEKGGCCLTTDEEGHSHLVDLTKESGETSWSLSEGKERGHAHPYVVSMEGKVTIGASDGHTHKIVRKAAPGKKPVADRDYEDDEDEGATPPKKKQSKAASGVPAGQEGRQPTDPDTMTDTTKAGGNVTAEQLEKLTKDLARATALAGLNDAQKAHMSKLDAAGQENFLKLDASGRDAELAKAAGGDPVIYTDRDGNAFRKSDDKRMVDAARRADIAVAKSELAEKRAKDAELAKRAGDELAHYPGELAAKVALLSAIDGIADEAVRKAASEILAAGEGALSMGFTRAGTKATPASAIGKASGDPLAKIDDLAKALVAKDPALTIEKARVKVLETPEGDALYAQSLGLA